MLRKTITIKNVGRFVNYAKTGDVELKKYNLVFAENGRGKTTLCAILRSLQSGEPSYVIGRTTLGSTATPEIDIMTDGGTHNTFKDGAWSATVPEIAIFDSTFVSENVHSGDVVAIEHRRSLYSVIVGMNGVDLAKQIDSLDSDSRAKSSEVKHKAEIVQMFAPSGLALESFLALPHDSEIDEKIAAKEKELESVKQAALIKSRAALSELKVPEFSDETLKTVLDTTLESVAIDAERRVNEQISAHVMAEHGRTWLSEGLGYIHETDACPFCGQSLAAASNLIRAYKDYFSEEYEGLRVKGGTVRAQIDLNLGERALTSLDRTLIQNIASVEFWARFGEIAAPNQFDITDLATLTLLREAAHSLIDRKVGAPLEKVPVDEVFADAYEAFLVTKQAINGYNEQVRNANATISAKKTATGAANVVFVQNELGRLLAIKKRHEPDVSNACLEYATALAEKIVIEGRKDKVRSELDEFTRSVIGPYQKTINNLLDDFNAGFRITGTKHGYPGGVASSSYQISINDTPVDLGDVATPAHKPSFRNTLSAGDKSTLALAFFLAQLEHDPNKKDKIVVFDDPFNSQDSFRKDCTVTKIKKCGTECAQVIVMSHDQSFLLRVWNVLTDASERKCISLRRVDVSNTTICAWDIEKETQAPFAANIEMLTAYHLRNDGKPRDVVQKIRLVLEAWCKLLGSGAINDSDTLGPIIDKIRGAGMTHQLFPQCDKLEELNIYTRRYHHGSNPQAATEPIDDGELHGYVKKTLDITGGC